MPICEEILVINYGERACPWTESLIEQQVVGRVRMQAAEEAGEQEDADYKAVFIVDGLAGRRGEILEKVQNLSAHLPVIVVRDDPDEVLEREVLHAGAQDVLLTTELGRPAVIRSLRYAIERNHNRLGAKLAESEQRLEAYRESQAFYHSLVETLTQGIFRKDRQGRFTFVNEQFTKNTGHQPVDFLGKTDFDFFPRELAQKYHDDDMEVLASGEGSDEVEGFETADGERLVVRTIKTPVRDPSGKVIGLQGIFWDITAEKRAEEELAASEERFEIAVRGSNDGIWDWKVTTGEVFYSDRFKQLLGYPPDGFENVYQSFETRLHPEDRDAANAAIAAHLQDRTPYDVEYRLRCKNGEYKWFRARGIAIWNEEGVATRMAGSISDITKRKYAEDALNLRTEELERSNKDLEQFAWVASHDLKEPLRAVSNYVQLLERRYSDLLDDDGKRFIGFAVDGAKRMRMLINDLLAFSRIGTRGKEMAPVQADAPLSTALKNLSLVIQERGAEIETEPLPKVWGDGGQLAQVFQNLIGNALKFCEETPKIKIWAAPEGKQFRFFVKDNGIGMDAGHTEQVFEIFQRLHTRDKYEGTGIGLALVRKIIDRHGGTVRVDSEPGKGATFNFTLKAAE